MKLSQNGNILFRSDTDWKLNACLNYHSPSLGWVASSYKEGAEALARATADGNAVLDFAILPIVYLYRHYVELTLKDLIDTARRVEREGSGYPEHHNLKNLWMEAKRLIRKHYGQNTPEELDHVEPYIIELHMHDSRSESFRYPTDKRGNRHLHGIKHINLRILYEGMQRLSSLLECIAADFDLKLEWMNEMKSDCCP